MKCVCINKKDYVFTFRYKKQNLRSIIRNFTVNVFHGNQYLQIGVQYTRSKNI